MVKLRWGLLGEKKNVRPGNISSDIIIEEIPRGPRTSSIQVSAPPPLKKKWDANKLLHARLTLNELIDCVFSLALVGRFKRVVCSSEVRKVQKCGLTCP